MPPAWGCGCSWAPSLCFLAVCSVLTWCTGASFQFNNVAIPGHPDHYANPSHAEIFFALYFVMTGLHALHMIVGIGIFLWLTVMAWKGRFTPEYNTPVEMGGLYWHFVDIIWIYLFPLLYLIDRHP